MSKVKVGLIQIHCGENIEQNIQKTMGKIKETANKGAQIVCLQELFSSEYFPQTVNVKNYDLAEETNSGNLVEMGELAKELAVVLIVPFYERAGSGVYFNSAAVFDADGECLGITRKIIFRMVPSIMKNIISFQVILGILSMKQLMGKSELVFAGMNGFRKLPES